MQKAGFVLFLGLLSLPAAAAHASVLTPEQWRADLEQLRDAIANRHFKPFRAIRETDFTSEIAKLLHDIPELSDQAVIVRMAAIVAAVSDGHTRLTIPERDPGLSVRLAHSNLAAPRFDSLEFTRLPVAFELFDDGLFVTAADAEHTALIGAKVLAIGNVSADEALRQAETIVSHDNAQTQRLLAPERLALPQVLAALGITATGCSTPLELSLPGGTTKTVVLQPMRASPSEWRTAVSHLKPPPLWLHHPHRNYWFQYLPADNAVYVQLNKIEDGPGESLAAFIGKTVALAARHHARYILDLRLDSGGSGSLNRSVVLALVRNPRVNAYGKLYVLIGRGTFSAAEMLVNDLEQYSNAIFVGEPTGSSPSQFGDPVKIRLENSGLTLRVATIFWHSWLADDTRDATPPALAVPLSSADYFAGRDPVLEKALRYRTPEGTIARFRALLTGADANSAAIFLMKHVTDPGTASDDLSPGLARLGKNLRDEGDIENSLYALMIGTMFYPDSSPLYAQLGLTFLRADRIPEAQRSFEKALKLDPKNRQAAEALQKLNGTGPDTH